MSELIQLAVTCIYANERAEDFPSIITILDCLPERDRLSKNEKLTHLHDSLDLLERRYEGSVICRKYDVNVSLTQLQQISAEAEDDPVVLLFERVCLAARNRFVYFSVSVKCGQLVIYGRHQH